MTRYEYYIKEARGGKLRSEDLRVILIFGRNINYVNELEKQEARRLISDKHINLNILGVTFLHPSKKEQKPAYRYNTWCKSITDCLSQEQWELLYRYYSSAVDASDKGEI